MYGNISKKKGLASEITNDNLDYISEKVKDVLINKQDKLTFDEAPTAGSENPVTSGGIKAAIDEVRESIAFVYEFRGSIGNIDSINWLSPTGKKIPVYNYIGDTVTIRQPYIGVPYLINITGQVNNGYDGKAGIQISSDEAIIFYKGLSVELVAAGGDNRISSTVYDITFDNDVSNITTGTAWIWFEDNQLDMEVSYIQAAPQITLEYGDNIALLNIASNVFIDKLTKTVDLSEYQEKLIFDEAPTEGSNNPVTSGGIKNALAKKANLSNVYSKSEIDAKLLNVYTPYGSAETDLQTFYMTAHANQVLDYILSETEFTYSVNVTYPSNQAIWNLSFSVDEDYGYSKTEVLFASSHCQFLNVGDKFTIKFDNNALYETTVISNTGSALTAIGDFTYAPTQGDGSIDTSRVASLILSCAIYVKHGDNIALVKLEDGSKFLDNLSGKSQSVLIFDSTPTDGSENPVTSKGIKAALGEKADKLKSIPHTTASGYPITLTDHLVNENLLSCKVYGADGGVGDLVASGEYAGKYAIPVVNRGKNLMELPKFGNASGITVSYQDGVYHIVPNESGSSSSVTMQNTLELKAGETVTISCKINHKGKRVNGLRVYSTSGTHAYIGNTGLNSPIAPSTELTKYSYTYTAPKDMTLNFQVFIHGFIDGDGDGKNDRHPIDFADFQIEYGTVATDYEPYGEPNEKTVYIDSPLSSGQYTEVDGLQTVDANTNIIEVKTTVQPSSIDITYYQDINKVLEEIKNAVLSQGGNV